MATESKFYPEDFISGSTWMVAQEMEKELAALKAEYQKLYGNYAKHDEWVNKLLAENDRYAQYKLIYDQRISEQVQQLDERDASIKNLINVNGKLNEEIKSLQADKAELLEALKDFINGDVSNRRLKEIESLLSKHDTKRPD